MNLATTSSHFTRNYATASELHASTWVEIDSKALEHNILQYKKIIGEQFLCPVIKSNAYGHGLEQVAKILEKNEYAYALCVVSLAEAFYVRSLGIQKPLLVLSILNAPLEKITSYDAISVVVYDIPTAQRLNTIAKEAGKKIKIHIKVDTGLSRLGILVDHALDAILSIKKMNYLEIEGIFTHFANSESANQNYTNFQIGHFIGLLEQLEKHAIEIPLRHASCSAALTANDKSHFTFNRTGIGIYGLWPSNDNYQLTKSANPGFDLKPVLTWKTTIAQIKELKANMHVGYDLTFKTHRATKIAVLPIGYWDGLDRKLSNKGCVYIQNQRAPIIGRIAMNLTMVDVTDIDVQQADVVTVLGNYPGISATDIAQICGTINYEIVTRINPLLPRIVI